MYFPIFRYVSDTTFTKRLPIKYYYSALSETKITSVSGTDFIHFLSTKPHIATEMSDSYQRNMRLLQSKLEFMTYTHSAYKKVCYFLLFLGKKFGEEADNTIRIIPSLTHKEISTFVGLSRESVSHQLSILKKKNVLREFRQTLSLKRLQLLEDEMRK
ncbi:MAG TPA: Crp/Fnr family transcriptional regulator, partial [Candidatus Saccharimonadales bacterium]|nr:Crp/Fnr family transcriptional regulator [Candidatus Saccharimonadales bacterium]